TPVTGQRLVPSWQFHDFRNYAFPFYRRVEELTGQQFCREFTMLRLFQSEQEAELFRKKRRELKSFLIDSDSNVMIDAGKLTAPWGGFEMPAAGQLLTVPFLQATRFFFQDKNCFQQENCDLQQDMIVTKSNSWKIERSGVEADCLVSCQGISGKDSFEFNQLPWKPAKGEILTVSIPGLNEERVINSGVWLIPLGNDLYRAGSNYEWHQLDQIPTSKGREDICRRLRQYLNIPFEVIDHQAAVRPSMEDLKPVLGALPHEPRVALLNGLGSKGALMAPLLAKELVDHLETGKELDPAIDLWTRLKKKTKDRCG
ncbi:MAG: FAD-binding oxidoreductase, partial [Planctomycetaceae bacterium]|nr:FAD-binding oxidoreductase [Planctomycetaceae bacterium]